LAVQNNNSFTLLYPLRGIFNSCFRLQPIPQPVISHRSRTGALLPVPVTRVGPGHFCRYRLPEMDRDAFAGTGYQRWCTSGFISSSYIAVIALFCSSVKPGNVSASRFDLTCPGEEAPGMMQLTSPFMSIQFRATWASRVLSGKSSFSLDTALSPAS